MERRGTDGYVECMTESASYLEIHHETILRLIDSGVLPAEKHGSVVRIRRSDLDRLIESGKLPPLSPN